MTTRAQIDEAIAAGYSTEDVLNHLAKTDKRVAEAVASGFAPSDIMTSLLNTSQPAQTRALETPEAPEAPEQSSMFQDVKQGLGNVGAGMVRGAGSIGATLLTPFDKAARAVGVDPNSMVGSFVGRTDRRQAIDSGLEMIGAQPDSALYKTGKFGAEVAGTMGAGGAVARGLGAIPGVARAASPLLNSIATGGFSASGLGSGATAAAKNIAVRMGGGGVAGGVSAGLVNPEDAGTGAAFGAALPAAGALAKGAGIGARKILGGTTGVGDEALKEAYRAGKVGGSTGKMFRDSMRYGDSMDEVVDAAKANLSAMNTQKQAAYRSGMHDISSDASILAFSNIDDAVNKAFDMATYKGQVKNKDAANVLTSIKDTIEEWKNLDPAEFHTPEGMDALKQRIGGLLENVPFEQKTARSAAGNVYNSIKSEINAQAPTYAAVMKDYSKASDTMAEIERALSLGKKASVDTSMRKLQSLMRNNVNTNYGYRDNLARQLEQTGGREFRPALAGQALNDFMPRGLQRAVNPAAIFGAGAIGNIPAAVGLGLASSPRIVGEGVYKAGQAARLAGKADPRLLQLLRQGAVIGGTQGQSSYDGM